VTVNPPKNVFNKTKIRHILYAIIVQLIWKFCYLWYLSTWI